MRDLHALVAANVYAELVTETAPPWERRTPMERALKAADDFVGGYEALEDRQARVAREVEEVVAIREAEARRMELELREHYPNAGEDVIVEAVQEVRAGRRPGRPRREGL